MGDPVTMAVIGASAGAMMNKKDPLKGALLGAAGGYAGGAFMPTLGAGATQVAGTGSALTGAGASTAANTAFMNPAGVNAAMGATTGPSGLVGVEAAKSGLFGGGMPATNAAMQGQGLAQTTAMQRPLSLGMPGVESSSLYEPTFMDKVGQLGQFAQQNPVLTQMAMQTGQGLLQQQQPQLQSPGLMRGNPSQVAAPQYQVGIPKVSLI